MNTLIATIKKIQTIHPLNIITFTLKNQNFTIITLELSPQLQIGSVVTLEVNSTHIILAQTNTLCTSANQLKCNIIAINNGKLLSTITIDIEGFKLESLLAFEAGKRLNLQENTPFIALINPSDISIVKMHENHL